MAKSKAMKPRNGKDTSVLSTPAGKGAMKSPTVGPKGGKASTGSFSGVTC